VIQLVLDAAIALILMPMQALPCSAPGFLVTPAGQAPFLAARAVYAPDARAIQVWPAAEGRVFCNGFEG
jgi:hypothetical protein